MTDDLDGTVDLDDEDSARLLAELGAALSAEISGIDVERAIDAFWMVRTDALVAELREELRDTDLVGVRGQGRTRHLTFSGESVAISLDVDPIDRRVAGEVSPEVVAARWVGRDGAATALSVDPHGRFDIVVDRGPACVEVHLADGQVVRSAWTLF
jgi:hypothetical protein